MFIYACGLEIFEVSAKTKHLSKFEREDQFLDRVNYTFSVSTDTGSKLLKVVSSRFANSPNSAFVS